MNNVTFISFVTQITKNTRNALDHSPSGSLNIKHCNGTVQYFQSHVGQSGKRTYIKKSNHALAVLLAQKDYNLKTLAVLDASLKDAVKFYNLYKKSDTEYCDKFMFARLYSSLDNIYNSLSPDRKTLVVPIVPVTRQYVENWLSLPYKKKEFSINDPTAYFTKQNVRVRSKSELYIANKLTDAGLLYKYECPLCLKGITIHPDFTVLDPYVRCIKYIEHCGMMDKPEYAENFIKKTNLYNSCGIFPGRDLIQTYESLKYPLDTRVFDSLMKYHFPFNF